MILDYSVTYDGIGPHWGNNHSYGYCSQVAIFKRKSIPVDDMIPIFNPGDRDLRTGLELEIRFLILWYFPDIVAWFADPCPVSQTSINIMIDKLCW